MIVTLVRSEAVAENIRTFWFRPQKPVKYLAGQYIEMYLPHAGADVRGQKHWFTLSSSPTEKLVSITTKHAVDRVSTFKQQLFLLKTGTSIKISEPMGDFVLPKDASIPLLFVAGGIGITPMRSMVKWLTDCGQHRTINLIYGARSDKELAFMDLFEAYGLKPQILLSDDPSGSKPKEHITPEVILDAAKSLHEPLVYISGPEPMTEKLEAGLQAGGFPAARLVLDFFPGYQPV